jgi:hypothetical protein
MAIESNPIGNAGAQADAPCKAWMRARPGGLAGWRVCNAVKNPICIMLSPRFGHEAEKRGGKTR